MYRQSQSVVADEGKGAYSRKKLATFCFVLKMVTKGHLMDAYGVGTAICNTLGGLVLKMAIKGECD